MIILYPEVPSYEFRLGFRRHNEKYVDGKHGGKMAREFVEERCFRSQLNKYINSELSSSLDCIPYNSRPREKE